MSKDSEMLKELHQRAEENGYLGHRIYARQDAEQYKKYRENLTPEQAEEIAEKLKKRERYGVLVWIGWGILIAVMIVCCVTGKPEWLFDFFGM